MKILFFIISLFLMACNPPNQTDYQQSRGYSERDFSEPTLEPQSDQYEGYCREFKEALEDDARMCADKEGSFRFQCIGFKYQYETSLFNLKYMTDEECRQRLAGF